MAGISFFGPSFCGRAPAILLVERHLEAGVAHLQRLGDALLDEFIERHAGGDFDDTAQHVGRHGIFPRRARLVEQRQLGELGRPSRHWSGPVRDLHVDDRTASPCWRRPRRRSGPRCGASGPGWSSAGAAARARAPPCRRRSSSRRRPWCRRTPECISTPDRASVSLPSSISIMAATVTIGLVIEAMRKIVSLVIGALASLSRKPKDSNITILPLRAISTTAPGSSLFFTPSLRRSLSRFSRGRQEAHLLRRLGLGNALCRNRQRQNERNRRNPGRAKNRHFHSSLNLPPSKQKAPRARARLSKRRDALDPSGSEPSQLAGHTITGMMTAVRQLDARTSN